MGKLEQSVREDADLTQVREAAGSQLATSFVNIGGRTSQEPLEGVILEACVQQDERYLVFLTDDIPHEDCLHIHLLDSNLSQNYPQFFRLIRSSPVLRNHHRSCVQFRDSSWRPNWPDDRCCLWRHDDVGVRVRASAESVGKLGFVSLR